ncbi:MAG: hypothetical protein WKG01_24460 [Kofleriaceae bacterium]
MAGRTTSGRRRATFALTACVLWLLGVEVLPNLHLSSHDADHTHEPDGTIIRVSFSSTHTHADGTVHGDHDDRERARKPRRETRDQLALDVPSSHAASGIAHHALGIHQPPPPVVDPMAVDRLVWRDPRTPADHALDRTATRPQARGPPVAARLSSITQ